MKNSAEHLMSTLPVSLMLRMVHAALSAQIEETRRRLTNNRGAPTAVHDRKEGRASGLANLVGHAGNVAMLLRGKPKGRVPCEVAALVTALALGHAEARADLVAALTSAQNPAKDRVSELPGWDITGIVCALLGKDSYITVEEKPDED